MLLGQVAGAGITELIGGDGHERSRRRRVASDRRHVHHAQLHADQLEDAGDALQRRRRRLILVVADGGQLHAQRARRPCLGPGVWSAAAATTPSTARAASTCCTARAASTSSTATAATTCWSSPTRVNPQGAAHDLHRLGSTFNGGAGTDTLSIGGVVEFQGTLSSIERIYLQPAFVSAAPNGRARRPRRSSVSQVQQLDVAAGEPGPLGHGHDRRSISIRGDIYDAAGWTIDAGSAVAVHVTGSGNGRHDHARRRSPRRSNDDGGIDTAVFSGNSADYVAAAGTGGAVTSATTA